MQITYANYRKPQTLFGFIYKYLKIKVTPSQKEDAQSFFQNADLFSPQTFTEVFCLILFGTCKQHSEILLAICLKINKL